MSTLTCCYDCDALRFAFCERISSSTLDAEPASERFLPQPPGVSLVCRPGRDRRGILGSGPDKSRVEHWALSISRPALPTIHPPPSHFQVPTHRDLEFKGHILFANTKVSAAQHFATEANLHSRVLETTRRSCCFCIPYSAMRSPPLTLGIQRTG